MGPRLAEGAAAPAGAEAKLKYCSAREADSKGRGGVCMKLRIVLYGDFVSQYLL